MNLSSVALLARPYIATRFASWVVVCSMVAAGTFSLAAEPDATAKSSGATGAAFDRCVNILKFAETTGNVEPTKTDAVHALGLLGDERAVPVLVEYLGHSPNSHLRLEIARALGWIGSPTAVPALEKALTDDYPFVRERAAIALKKITGKTYEYDRTGLPDPEKMRQYMREQAAKKIGGS